MNESNPMDVRDRALSLVELDTAVVLLKKGWKLYDNVTIAFGRERKVNNDSTL